MLTFRTILAGLTALAAALALPAPAHAGVVEPFTVRFSQPVHGDFITVGNTVMDCPPGNSDCTDTQQGAANFNNNSFMMQRANFAGLPGAFDSSSAELTVPAGGSIVYARLFWGGNTGTYRSPFGGVLSRCDISQTRPPEVTKSPGDPLTAPVQLRVGGGATDPVSPEVAHQDPDSDNGPHYYTAEAEVTDAFAGATPGAPVTVTVGDVWAADGLGCVAGWSLTVVYDTADGPGQEDKRNVYIWGGHVLQRSSDPDTMVPVSGFTRAGAAPTHVSFTAYEGDRATSGDQFLVNGENIPEPSTGSTGNFFISAADGSTQPGFVNNLNVDAKEFEVGEDVIEHGDTSAELTFRTTNDTYLAQQLAFSVPVPDIMIAKTAEPAAALPGDKVTFTITVTNDGSIEHPNAVVTDDLSGLLDDAAYHDDASASAGTVSYAEPTLSWSAKLGAHETVTITYSVTVGNPPAGDRLLRNQVLGADSNCAAGGHDPLCHVEIPVSVPILPVAGQSPAPVVLSGAILLGAGLLLRLLGRRRSREA